MHGKHARAGLCEFWNPFVRAREHDVDVDQGVSARANRTYKVRSEEEAWDTIAVHNIDVESVDIRS